MNNSVKLYNVRVSQIISYFDQLEEREANLFWGIEKLEEKPPQSIIEPVSFASKLLLDELKQVQGIKREIMNTLVSAESELFSKIALI